MRYYLHYSLETDRSREYRVERFTYTLHFTSECTDLTTVGMVEIKRDQLLMILHHMGLGVDSIKNVKSLGRSYWLLAYGILDGCKFHCTKGDIYLLRMLNGLGVHNTPVHLWRF